MQTPNLETVTSQACTANQFAEPVYQRLCSEINQELLFHRKQWEYIYILRVLEQFGMLSPERSGLGFGCGKEPLAAVMAKRGATVTCTDIMPENDSDPYWGSTSVDDFFYEGICSLEQFRSLVSFRPVDMNAIPDNLGVYDFIWSSCALEHLGSLRHGINFVLNANKCLKPNGIAVHTTELNVKGENETLETKGLSLYRKKDILHMKSLVEEQGNIFLPVNFDMGDTELDTYVDLPPYNRNKHLKLMIAEKYVTTSIGFVVIKGENASMQVHSLNQLGLFSRMKRSSLLTPIIKRFERDA
jgi:2-polyprenyl-3-methyl-5-hydroxy-6-metoxy-1,4-benzoquinol methylase